MNKKQQGLSGLLALSLLCSGMAQAQPHERVDRGERDDRQQQSQRGDDRRHEQRRDQRQDHRYAQRSDGRYDSRQGGHYEGRGAGPEYRYYRGQRLPPQYRGRQYVVEDWRGHQLYAPPRGYHWVQAGGDYLLVAIATGLILQLMLSN